MDFFFQQGLWKVESLLLIGGYVLCAGGDTLVDVVPLIWLITVSLC